MKKEAIQILMTGAMIVFVTVFFVSKFLYRMTPGANSAIMAFLFISIALGLLAASRKKWPASFVAGLWAAILFIAALSDPSGAFTTVLLVSSLGILGFTIFLFLEKPQDHDHDEE